MNGPTQECDGFQPGDWCTEGIVPAGRRRQIVVAGGVIRHIQHERFRSTQWLCLKHKREQETASDTPKNA